MATDTRDTLTVFLYFLLRDHVPSGRLVDAVNAARAATIASVASIEAEPLAMFAAKLARLLRPELVPDSEA